MTITNNSDIIISTAKETAWSGKRFAEPETVTCKLQASKKQLKKMNKRNDVYTWEELLASLPKDKSLGRLKITVRMYGFVHDVGIEVTWHKATPQETPTNLDELEKEFRAVVDECRERWEFANEFGYH